jgi:heptosyltransferase-2
LLAGFSYTTHTWPNNKWQAIKLLRSFTTKKLILFPNSFSSAWLGKLGGKQTIGYRKDARFFLLNQAIDPPNYCHETDVFYHLTKTFITANSNTGPLPFLIPKLNLSPSCIQTSQKILKSHQVHQNFILLCPFAHGLNRRGQVKTWPQWQKLYQTLLGNELVICPGPNELKQAQEQFPRAKIIPDLPLDQYAAIAHHAKLVIANDSGPMHLAAAIGAPTLGIFGATDPNRAAPRNIDVLGDFEHWPSLEQVMAAIKQQGCL